MPGTIETRVRNKRLLATKLYRSFVLVPHEICVKNCSWLAQYTTCSWSTHHVTRWRNKEKYSLSILNRKAAKAAFRYASPQATIRTASMRHVLSVAGQPVRYLFGWIFTYRKRTIPKGMVLFLTGSYLSFQAASSQVLSTYKGLTTVFGMGTGGAP